MEQDRGNQAPVNWGEERVEDEPQFRLLLDYSPDAVFVMDPHDRQVAWRIVACNDIACRMNGYTREELLGQSLHILDTGDSTWVDDDSFLDRLRRKKVIRGVTPHRRKDGSVFFIEYSTSLLTSDGRELALGVDRDLTERHQIEAELQRAKNELEQRVEERTAELATANAQLRAELALRERAEMALRSGAAELHFQARLLDAVDQSVITTDLHGRITYWNRFAQALYGWAAHEAVGKQIGDMMPAPDLEVQGAAIFERLRSGESWSGTFQVRRRDGTTFLALIANSPIYDTSGTLIGVVGVSSDISERVRAEERSNFLASASAVLVSSLDYTMTATQLVQLIVAHIADWCIIDLITPERTLHPLAVAHADLQKEALLHELRRRYPLLLDDPKPGSVNVALSGEPQLFAHVTDDLVRSYAQDEQQLALYQAIGYGSSMVVPLTARGLRLGALTIGSADPEQCFNADDLAVATELASRTALAIDNARLYTEAQQAVRARDEFLSIAAHELKTPITSILGYGEMLQIRFQRDPDAPYRDVRAVATIAHQAERLTRLVNSLLDIARIETGHFTLDLQILDLQSVVERIIEEIEPSLEHHTIELLSTGEPLFIEGDDLRLEQAVLNLIQNAIKYSPEGGPVTVRLTCADDAAELAVSDQGIGIPEEAHSHLFQRFFRADADGASAIQGMGIGLYVVKEIVARHGGTVGVESVEGEGSTFIIRLPLASELEIDADT